MQIASVPRRSLSFPEQLPAVSVVMASRNEEQTIAACIGKIRKAFASSQVNGEIVLADNSIDNTPGIATSLGARVVTPDKLGYGYAYLHGLCHAMGKYLVIGDADDTYDFADIPRMVEPLQRGDADLVLGSRLKGKIEKGAMPWLHQYIGNPAITWLFNRIFGAKLSDVCSGMLALTRETWAQMDIVADGWDFNQEILVWTLRNRLRIKEVPITYHPRNGGASKLTALEGGWRNLKFMAAHASLRPNGKAPVKTSQASR